MAQTPRRGPSVYQARIEAYLARHPGASRAEARGHKDESLERLRRRAAAHIVRALERSGTKGVVSADRVRNGVRRMSREMLRQVMTMSGDDLKAAAHFQKEEDWREYFEAVFGEAPDDRQEFNPLWYHP